MHRQIAGSLTGRVTKWIVLAVMLVLGGASAVVGSHLSDVQDNQNSSFLPGNAESTRALDKLSTVSDPDSFPTLMVYERKSGLTPDDLAAGTADAKKFASVDGVVGKVIGPIPSKDGKVMQTVVTVNLGSKGFQKIPGVVDDLTEIAKIPGVKVYAAGQGGQFADAARAFGGVDTTLLFSALIVVIVILLVTYRSPVLWVLPVFSVVIGLFIAQAVVYLLAKNAGLTVNGQSQGILYVLVFGAGTDYALLLVARYREELRRHEDRHEAMAFALHRASPAIIASAATVAISMLCLTLAELNSTAGLGPVLAIGVGAALLAMITLLPALLVIFGRWVFWPLRPTYGSDEPSTRGLWARVGSSISARPRQVWMVTTGALLVCCLGMFALSATGLSNEDSYTKEFDSIKGQKVLQAHGLADTSTPIQIVTNTDKADAVVAALDGVDGIGTPEKPVAAGDVAYVAVPLDGDPSSKASQAVVDRVRDKVHAVDGADALVGGATAINLDIQRAATRDSKVIIPVVLVVVLLILMLLLRALFAPLLLIGSVVLSFGAALGISALLFRHVFGFAGEDASFPLFVFVFLVALGIDYNIFLMTRVREETANVGTRLGALVALRTTGGVITSAGIVLAATFLVLGTLPLVFLAELGTAVALGVLLDTFIVRSVLVTALAVDLKGRIWWPSKLDRDPAVAEPAEVG